MKIGLYGVSRCGKDYLIRQVLATVSGLQHIRGSYTLRQLAKARFGTTFDALDETDKKALRIAFADKVKSNEQVFGNIIVDGHYAFPVNATLDNNGHYHVVFTAADWQLYDVFIYMNTPPERVVKNQCIVEPERRVIPYTVDEVAAWQKYEIDGLRAACKAIGKELLVIGGGIDGDSVCATAFMAALVSAPHRYLPKPIAAYIVAAHRKVIADVGTVVLVDCDKTLAANDTTLAFCDYAEFDRQILRDNYHGEYYSVYQFYRANRLYDEAITDGDYYAACANAAHTAQMNEALIADIKAGPHEAGGFVVFGVTSGILDIWKRIQASWVFPDILVGKGRAKVNVKAAPYDEVGGLYVSAMVKQAIVKELHTLGKQVIAIGDSPIDIGMLEEADNGFLVAALKRSTGMEAYFADTPSSRLRQLAYNPCKYDGVREVSSVWQS